MPPTALNRPSYRLLRTFGASEEDAQDAAETATLDLSHLSTKDDLKLLATKEEIKSLATKDGLRAEIAVVRQEIAQAMQRQSTCLAGLLVISAGLVTAAQRLAPLPLPSDAVRALVEQTARNLPPR